MYEIDQETTNFLLFFLAEPFCGKTGFWKILQNWFWKFLGNFEVPSLFGLENVIKVYSRTHLAQLSTSFCFSNFRFL